MAHKEFRVIWHAKGSKTLKVLFVEAGDMKAAGEIAMDHIERKLGIIAIVRTVKVADEVPEGRVLSKPTINPDRGFRL